MIPAAQLVAISGDLRPGPWTERQARLELALVHSAPGGLIEDLRRFDLLDTLPRRLARRWGWGQRRVRRLLVAARLVP